MRFSLTDVGRDRKSWATTMPEVSYERFLGEIRRHGALLSRDISFEFKQDDPEHGYIFAGIRPVGTFTIEESEDEGT